MILDNKRSFDENLEFFRNKSSKPINLLVALVSTRKPLSFYSKEYKNVFIPPINLCDTPFFIRTRKTDLRLSVLIFNDGSVSKFCSYFVLIWILRYVLRSSRLPFLNDFYVKYLAFNTCFKLWTCKQILSIL